MEKPSVKNPRTETHKYSLCFIKEVKLDHQ